MKNLFVTLAFLLGGAQLAHAVDSTLAVTPGTGATIVVSPDGSGNIIPHTIYCDRTTPTQCVAIDASGRITLVPNQSVNTAQVNGVTTLAGAGAVGTGSQRVAVGQDVTTIAGSAPGTAGTASTNVLTIQGITSMIPILVTPAANSAVNVAQVGGTNTVNGGVAGSQSIGGTVANNVAITDNPINNGAQAVSSENTAVTTARKVQLVADLVGKLIVLPYSNPENFLTGTITTAMTGTTSTAVTNMGAQGSGVRVNVTWCIVSNAHATVGTDIVLQDGSGGTTLATLPAAANYGGSAIQFSSPIRTTANTALFAANVTTGASTKVSCGGYKGV